MSEHTKEPWKYYDNGFDAGIIGSDNSGRFVFGGEPSEGRLEKDDPNVRRTIACVNACAGMMTEDLEDGEIQKIRQEHAEYRKQRDEALGLLAVGLTDDIGFKSVRDNWRKMIRDLVKRVGES